VSLALFWRDRVPADVVALGVLLSLVLTRVLPANEAFAGFASDTVLTILGLLLLTSSLQRTGVVDWVGDLMVRRLGGRTAWVPIALMLTTFTLSALINNTAATAFILPVAIGLARRSRLNPSRVLLPVAFASILASSVTLIATSTNLVVSGLMVQKGMAPIRFFELTPVGLAIGVCGIVYMVVVGVRLLPERSEPANREEAFGLRPYLTEVVVLEGSPLAGKTLAEAGLGRELDLNVLSVLRGARRLMASPELALEEGDLLVVEGDRDNVLKIKDRAGIDIKADAHLADTTVSPQEPQLAEALLLPASPLIGSTLKDQRFRERYNLQVLAIHRHGETLHRKLSEVRLTIGDVLLLQGPPASLGIAEQDLVFRVLGSVQRERPNRERAPHAIVIFALALAAGASGLLPLPVAVLLGALLAFVAGCVAPDQAYRDVEWRILILIASMLALGKAMDSSGTAGYLAGLIVQGTDGFGGRWLLGGFFILTVFLTQPMSNQAAAAVVFPVAVETALRSGLDPRPFAIALAVAASCSFLTPLEPSCMMVYGPGRYRFADFLRVGSILTLIILALAVWLIPVFWPLGAGLR
jgi:di/tricarboxylate transporter